MNKILDKDITAVSAKHANKVSGVLCLRDMHMYVAASYMWHESERGKGGVGSSLSVETFKGSIHYFFHLVTPLCYASIISCIITHHKVSFRI